MNQLDTTGERECENCGRHVSRGFARVFGDANGTVHRCRDCDTVGRLMDGSAAGIDPDGRTDPTVDTTRARRNTRGKTVMEADA